MPRLRETDDQIVPIAQLGMSPRLLRRFPEIFRCFSWAVMWLLHVVRKVRSCLLS